jgi:hypothetical protein
VAGDIDPEMRIEIGGGNSYVIIENSQLRARFEPFFADFSQFGIRSLILKWPGHAEQVCCGTNRYMGTDAGRGPLESATILYDGIDRKTIEMVWRNKHNSAAALLTHEVSIYPNQRFIRTDYIDVRNGLNIIDIGQPGGIINGVHIAYGGDTWVRGYVTRDYVPTVGGYYNRYPPDGVNDPADGGSLNYNGHFIVGVYNPGNGVGFGRVGPVADMGIIKLLISEGQRNGLEFFPHPFFQSHAPFTDYIYFVDGGETEMMADGQQLADGNLGGPIVDCNDPIDLTAEPYTHWNFAGWSGDVSGPNNPASLVLAGANQVGATFTMDPATYAEPFNTYAVGADPNGWFDTVPGGLSENDALYKVFDVDGDAAFGTSSGSINIHSHYVGAGIDPFSSHTYTGRMRLTVTAGGVGVTFLSRFPQVDAYYRLRSFSANPFEISPHGTSITGGTTVTDLTPAIGQWYRFVIETTDTGARTEIRAKVWADGRPEPGGWQIDCFDDSPTRHTSGTVGVWSMSSGQKFWDDLAVFTPSTCSGDLDGDGSVNITDLGALLANFGLSSGATLADGDVNGDGAVNVADLGILLAEFGATCQ